MARSLRERLLRQNEPVQLELGSNNPRKDWITIDVLGGADLILDLTKPLPFPDGTVDKIYSSHLLEHFYYSDVIALLKECYRVLKNHGTFSVCVPDASIYISAYCNNLDIRSFCKYEPAFHYHSPIDFVNYIAYMDGHHKHMYDRENLTKMLKDIGFQTVKLRDFDGELDLKERAYESIYALAIK
jgi:predicted SAM-dependent methyltransferase